jgi:hypothetical protein
VLRKGLHSWLCAPYRQTKILRNLGNFFSSVRLSAACEVRLGTRVRARSSVVAHVAVDLLASAYNGRVLPQESRCHAANDRAQLC